MLIETAVHQLSAGNASSVGLLYAASNATALIANHSWILADVTSSQKPDRRHHPWIFEWDKIWHTKVVYTSIVLYVSGVLCSAAGIGGGGIYVAVLMMIGQLAPYDAVPLSKAIVFFGSVSSLLVNISRMMSRKGGESRTVINFYVCRTVVPPALAGTFVGVFANHAADDRVIVVLLVALLALMTGLVLNTYRKQRAEESEATVEEDSTAAIVPASDDNLGTSSIGDMVWAASMLTVVIIGGVMRHHVQECRLEKIGHVRHVPGSCSHPIILKVFGTNLDWMERDNLIFLMNFLAIGMPTLMCTIAAIYYGSDAHTNGNWEPRKVIKFQAVGMATGILAGLVGVGGGLILSPFFLVMGMDPAVAVGTSSTCVLFTSSSTTMQYIFTDRIIMHFAVVYGAVTLMASYSGTSLTHMLQDKFAGKRSHITLVVAAGVGISGILALAKLWHLVIGEEPPDGHG